MRAKKMRRPGRADVAHSLRELEILFRPPDGINKTAAKGATEATAEETKLSESNSTPTPRRVKFNRGRR